MRVRINPPELLRMGGNPVLSEIGKFALTLLLLLGSPMVLADAVRVAVASNFLAAMDVLKEDFSKQTGHEILISSGSTGKLYAQIRNGAPFEVFLAADSERR